MVRLAGCREMLVKTPAVQGSDRYSAMKIFSESGGAVCLPGTERVCGEPEYRCASAMGVMTNMGPGWGWRGVSAMPLPASAPLMRLPNVYESMSINKPRPQQVLADLHRRSTHAENRALLTAIAGTYFYKHSQQLRLRSIVKPVNNNGWNGWNGHTAPEQSSYQRNT